jgi:hypothetical protein
MRIVESPLSEMDQSTLEIAFRLINKRFETTLHFFVVLISFLIFYLLPTESSIVAFFFFVFLTRMLEMIVLFLKIQFHSTSAVTVSNLILLRANQSVEKESKSSLPGNGLTYDEKITETIDRFNNRKWYHESYLHANFIDGFPEDYRGKPISKVFVKASVWYLEYLLFILPAALGFWMR